MTDNRASRAALYFLAVRLNLVMYCFFHSLFSTVESLDFLTLCLFYFISRRLSLVYTPYFLIWSLLHHGSQHNLGSTCSTRMMSRKRKASSPASTNRDYNSRRKQLRAACDFLSESESESESESKGDGSSELDDGEYLVKCILDEDDTRYLIDWEGPWSPTWVRLVDCSSLDQMYILTVWTDGNSTLGTEGVRQRSGTPSLGRKEKKSICQEQ